MIIQFSVRNFKTFKNKVTLSLVASNYDKTNLEDNNVYEIEKFSNRLLKSLVVFGANASGKTKLFDAMAFMRWFVVNSSVKTQEGDEIDTDTFRFNSESELGSSEFEIIYLLNNIQYRYGFEITREKVISEWLFQKKLTKKPKEVELFYRDDMEIFYHNSFKKMKLLIKEGDGILRNNALLLSVSNQFKVKEAKEIVDYFRKFNFLLGNEPFRYQEFSLSQISLKSEIGSKIIETMKRFDTGISDVEVKEIRIEDNHHFPAEIRDKISELTKKGKDLTILEAEAIHKKFDAEYNFIDNVRMDFDEDESSGTQKLLAILGPIFETLISGHIIVIDELDSRLHPKIVTHIVQLFNSKETNPRNSQLIINTHNSNLLSENLFRRDQIWFTEKNRYGEGMLISLSEFKVRQGENFEEKYLEGRFGGIPFIKNLNDLFN